MSELLHSTRETMSARCAHRPRSKNAINEELAWAVMARSSGEREVRVGDRDHRHGRCVLCRARPEGVGAGHDPQSPQTRSSTTSDGRTLLPCAA